MHATLRKLAALALVFFASLAALQVVVRHTSTTETVLHAFSGVKTGDGALPLEGLISDRSGALYGSTPRGGSQQYCAKSKLGCGVVFKMTPNGSGYQERIVWAFLGGNDGAFPSGVDDHNGSLYGTTNAGGQYHQGTVFALTPKGSFYSKSTLYAFHSKKTRVDGRVPMAAPITDANGAVYGTTTEGGRYGFGAAFKLTPQGSAFVESLLYSFGSSGAQDGNDPFAGLVFDGQGVLYGTTVYGGTTNAYCPKGCGTVYSLTSSGSGYVENILYRFQGSSDGAFPYSRVKIDKDGDIYGTTLSGGYSCSQGNGCGTVYELVPSASGYTEKLIYRFTGGASGQAPTTRVVLGDAGVLYGTTTLTGCQCGTVYQLTPSPSGYMETVLHTFGASGDGLVPSGDLITDKNGALYGTTTAGGSGLGTVYRVTP